GTERNADQYRTTGREGPLAPTHSASPHSRIGPPTSLRCYGRQIIAPPWSRKIPRLPAQAPEVHFLQDYDGPPIAAGENHPITPTTRGVTFCSPPHPTLRTFNPPPTPLTPPPTP